jgi:hypothetical protein
MQTTHSHVETTKTVRIEAKKTDENPSGYVVINHSDFDEKTHKVYQGPDYVPPAGDQSDAPMGQTFTQEQLDATVAAAVEAALAKREEAAKTAQK